MPRTLTVTPKQRDAARVRELTRGIVRVKVTRAGADQSRSGTAQNSEDAVRRAK